MTETTAYCGRCGETIEGSPIGVSVDGGPLHSTDHVLDICSGYAGSLDQPRHRKHRSRRGRNGLPERL